MRIFTLMLLFCSVTLSVKAQSPIDFESGGNGASWTWTVFENGNNPPLEIVDNPSATGINTTSKVAKFTARLDGQTYAGVESQHGDITPFTLSASNSTIKIMVWKTVISDVGIKFAINNGGAQPEIKVANTKVNEWEELVFDFSGKIGLVETINIDQIIVFPDFATRAQENIVYFDNITFSAQASQAVSEPTTAATTPTRAAANVISLLSNAYTNVSLSTWKTDWSVATLTDLQVAGNDTKKYSNLDFVGIETGANTINASNMTFFHIDVWTPNITSFKVKLVDFGADGAYAGGDDKEHEVTLTPALNGWNSFEIPLADFTNLTTRANIAQIILVGVPSGTSTAYVDNVYFHNVAPAGPPALPGLPLDFESSSVTYDFVNFEGGVTTVVDNSQINTINTSAKVGKMVKNAGAVYAGSLIGLASPIDFSTNKFFKVKVFMPRVGAKLLLKVENQTDATKNFEKEVIGTVANAWEELTFDYTGINTANTYQKIVLIFDNGTAGDGSANFTYLFDDLRLTSGTPPPPSALPTLPLDFESATVSYNFVNFEGGVSSVISNTQSSTINTSAKVGKMVKNPGAVYAGSLLGLDAPIDFSSNKTFKVKVFMPRVGAKLLLKVENQSDPAKNFEKEATGTVANAWEELTFDYGAINTANTYQKIILIFDLGTSGDGSANFTYLFDDIRLTTSDAPPTTLPTLPLDFESTTVTYDFSNFEGGVSTVVTNTQSSSINSSAKVGKMVKNPGAVYAGSLLGLASPIDFSTSKTFKVKVFMPRVGAKLLLKVENQTDASKNFEKEVAGTIANAWEDLTFDFSSINTANTYQKIVLIFDLGTSGDGTANFTYLFDDLRLEATPQNQTITFPVISDKTVGNVPFNLAATSTSGLAISYTTTSDKVSIAGSQVTIVKAGRVNVTATQSGNATFNAAVPVERSFCIKPAKPVITSVGDDAESITLTSSADSGNQWYLNGSAITGQINKTLLVNTPGTYKVQVKADDCASDFSEERSFIITGISKEVLKIEVYPNPALHAISVKGLQGTSLSATAYDLAGKSTKLILDRIGDAHIADVQHLASGLYVLRVVQGVTAVQIKFLKK